MSDADWIARNAARIAAHAPRELEALVGVSSPSGDRAGAEECVAIVSALLPLRARVERPPSSMPGYAPDLLATLAGDGARRLLLLGHLDTVVAHDAHRPLERVGERLVGSGTVDMKGGDVIALGVLHALAERPGLFAEVALLLVTDEEWRTCALRHVERFAGYDACLCFEAGAAADGEEAVIVRRKAAGTLRLSARGVAAHSGVAPERGRSALLALAQAARSLAAQADPDGAEHLTVVPTMLHSGAAMNVVPDAGELHCDLRADHLEAFGPVLAAAPRELDGVTLQCDLIRSWPGMDSEAATGAALAGAQRILGRAIRPAARGGASDASHIAAAVPLTIDGLGPRGGGAHNPDEYVVESSLQGRAEIALALAAALLEDRG